MRTIVSFGEGICSFSFCASVPLLERHFYIVILEWHGQLVERDRHLFLAFDTIPYLLDFGRVQILCWLHIKYID